MLCGLPGSGKTTRARRIEEERSALRLTPDEWMIPLFGEPEAGGKRDVLEGRLIWLALRALRGGVDVVLDFGVWGRDERSALRWLAERAGAAYELVYLPVGAAEQWARVSGRPPESTFAVTAADLATFRRLFQEPDDAELSGAGVSEPPDGYRDWADWAATRWPTSV